MAITDAQKLMLYNGGLRFISEGRISTLTENRGPRRVLDDIWDDGAVRFCLENGMWNFATRVTELEYNPSLITEFGFKRVFEKPDDFVRTCAVNSDPYFVARFTAYDDKGPYLYADIDKIYFAYVSDDAAYGMDYTLWPESFKQYVEAYLGIKSCKMITGSEPSDKMLRDFRKIESGARSKDAMSQSTKTMPAGTWSMARRTGGSNWRENA